MQQLIISTHKNQDREKAIEEKRCRGEVSDNIDKRGGGKISREKGTSNKKVSGKKRD